MPPRPLKWGTEEQPYPGKDHSAGTRTCLPALCLLGPTSCPRRCISSWCQAVPRASSCMKMSAPI